MRLHLVLCALLTSSLIRAQSAPATPKPVSKIELVQLVATGSSTPRVRAIINARGLGFQPDEALLNELGSHRNDTVLLAIIRTAKVVKSHETSVDAEASAKESQVLRHLLRAATLNRNDFHAQAAEPEFRAAVEADPSNPFAHLALGKIVSRMQKPEAAEAEFRIVLELAPDLAEAHLELGRAFASDPDKRSSAITEYKKAVELAPYDLLAQYFYASAQLDEHDWKKAADKRRELSRKFGNVGTPHRIRVGGKVMEDKLISRSPTQYPFPAQEGRIQGTVRTLILVGTDGNVIDWEVMDGHPLLTEAALASVRQWRYQPTLLNKVPVEIITEVDIRFALGK